MQAALKVEDVFSLELVLLRARLKDFTARLVQLEPGKAGSKAMDYYWRKAFHEPVSLARQLKGGGWSRVERGLLESHLLAGLGHYQLTIDQLKEQFAWQPAVKLDFAPTQSYGWAGRGGERRTAGLVGEEGGPDPAWVEATVVRCLGWLGDLARYLSTELEVTGWVRPERYYLLAVELQPGAGAAYNSLAALAGPLTNQGLDQIYWGLRCLTATRPAFPAARPNLDRALERAGRSGAGLVPSLARLVVAVLAGAGQEEVSLCAQQGLASLQAGLGEAGQAGELAGSWLSITVAVLVMLVEHKTEPVCQACLLALLSHLAASRSAAVLAALPGLAAPEPSQVIAKENSKKKRLELMRRRRPAQSGSEGEDTEDSSEEIFDSDEEDVVVDDDDEEDESYLVDSSSEEEEEDEERVTLADLVTISNTGQELQGITVCLAWLEQHGEVVEQTGPGSEQLWANLASLFSLLSLRPRHQLLPFPEPEPGLAKAPLQVRSFNCNAVLKVHMIEVLHCNSNPHRIFMTAGGHVAARPT